MNEGPLTQTDKSNFAPAYTWAQYRIWAATAAIGSYLYTGRHQYLVVSYQSTARQLERLLTEWKISGSLSCHEL